VRNRRAVIAALAIALAAASPAWANGGPVTVRYTAPSALHGLHVTLRVDALHVAEVATSNARALRARPGIVWVHPTVSRSGTAAAPARVVTSTQNGNPEWQYVATRANIVPGSVLRAAAKITIAVIDTGADLSAPALAQKSLIAYSVISNNSTVTDLNGHGTFVASLAAGSVRTGSLLHGFGGDARLMVVQANSDANDFTDANEAAAIVWAVDHGARIINLSLGGPDTSQVEEDAIAYAYEHGVLLVAAAGNQGQNGNVPTYPGALLGGKGLAVAASTTRGRRAAFSTAAPYVSIAAPGVNVLGALASTSSASVYPRATLPGLYGYGTGTSYAAPQVAGAAALVWAANPRLTAAQVIDTLERTASRPDAWSTGLGYGVIDIAAAVASASGKPAPPVAKSSVEVITLQPLQAKR
jgi:subtilisin family serine protease